VPVHPGRDVGKGTLRGILADVGMTVEELQRLL
jgi:predicted RNA binding protein YcfA (HicA-like mRNA interferase family)